MQSLRISPSTWGLSLMLVLGIANAADPAEPAMPDLPPVQEAPVGGAAMPDLPPVQASTDITGSNTTASAPSQPLGIEVQLWWLGYEDRVLGANPARSVSSQAGRVALDIRREWTLDDGWRTGFSNRLDRIQQPNVDAGAPDRERTANSLREAWVSKGFGTSSAPMYLDVGRINWRLGVANGYNPSDFFKTNAVRTVSSLDPGSVRLDRLGVFMVRGQALYSGGAISLALAPKLTERNDANDRPFALGLEQTNRHAAYLLKWSPQLNDRGTLDLQLFQREGEKTQVAANATWLASDALVLYGEWAAGRRTPLQGPTSQSTDLKFAQRAAAGGTYTFGSGIDLSLELQHTGDALSRSDWNQWRSAPDAATQIRLGSMANTRGAQQEPLVRSNWFVRSSWREPFAWRGVDVSGFVQGNAYDNSKVWQLKVSWRLDERYAIAAQTGGYRGTPDSEFGSTGPKGYASVYVSAFF